MKISIKKVGGKYNLVAHEKGGKGEAKDLTIIGLLKILLTLVEDMEDE